MCVVDGSALTVQLETIMGNILILLWFESKTKNLPISKVFVFSIEKEHLMYC